MRASKKIRPSKRAVSNARLIPAKIIGQGVPTDPVLYHNRCAKPTDGYLAARKLLKERDHEND